MHVFEITELGIDIGGFNYRNKKWKVLRELFVLDLCDVAGEDKKREEFTKFRTILSETEACLTCWKFDVSWLDCLSHLSNSHFLGPKDFLCDFRNKSLPRFYNNWSIEVTSQWCAIEVRIFTWIFTSATVQESSFGWRSETKYC